MPANYQASGMEPMIYYLLEQLTEDLASVRSIEYLHAGLYEGTKKKF